MTIEEFVDAAAAHPWLLLAVFAALPGLAALLGSLHTRGRGEQRPWCYCYCVLVYAVCIPGMAAVGLSLYSVVFIRANLLQANVLVYFLPIISMGLGLVFMKRSVNLDRVPGTDRLWGLMLMMGTTFLAVFLLERTRLWLIFGASMAKLLVLIIVIFVAFRWSSRKLFGGRAG